MVFLATGGWSAKFDGMLKDISVKRANRSKQELGKVLTANRVSMAFVLARAVVSYVLGTRSYRHTRLARFLPVTDASSSHETYLSEVLRSHSPHFC